MSLRQTGEGMGKVIRDAYQVEKQLGEKELKGKKAVRVLVDGDWSKLQ